MPLTLLKIDENGEELPVKKPRKLGIVAQFVFIGFAPAWVERYHEKYRMTGMDAKYVKEFLDLNADVMENIADIQLRAEVYLKDRFKAWEDQRHPVWGFVKHYNRYTPVKEKKVRMNVKTEECPHCFNLKPVNGKCPTCLN